MVLAEEGQHRPRGLGAIVIPFEAERLRESVELVQSLHLCNEGDEDEAVEVELIARAKTPMGPGARFGGEVVIASAALDRGGVDRLSLGYVLRASR